MLFCLSAVPAFADVDSVIKELNESPSVVGSDDIKSYKILFDAYLKMSKPPMPVDENFNLTTIHPKMSQWSAVSGWAESNADMAKAIVACKQKAIIGLPYGAANVDPKYREKDLFVDIGAGGSLRNNTFNYLKPLDEICAFATAETYRLMEAGKIQDGLDLCVASTAVLRQFCDRDFLQEKLYGIELLSAMLSNMRDVFYAYREKISSEQFSDIASWEIPFLRPDRSRLFMPEGDRIVATELINEVFRASDGSADPKKFADTFAEIQSREAPLTRFGAAKRWAMIAAVHSSREDSINKIKLIFDDWWRRWRWDPYDPMLDMQTEFERMNPIRYAAVLYSVQDVETLFSVRNQLRVEVNGTAVAAGICGYSRAHSDTFPDQTEKAYNTYMRKASDFDPFDKHMDQSFHPFIYRIASARQSVDTPEGRVWVEPGEAILYSIGQDHTDNLAQKHTNDGAAGDIVMWPPIKTLERRANPPLIP